MDNQFLNQLYQYIKEDNVKGFDSLITDRLLSLKLGRFPLLSLMYLNKSYSLLAKYEDRLKEVTDADYINDDEPQAIYNDFKNVVGKAMRFYLSDRTVEPEEMLAIIGSSQKLESEWLTFQRYPSSIENIRKIYQLNFDQTITVTRMEIILPKIKVKGKKNGMFNAFIAIALVFALICAISITSVCEIIGLGTVEKPIKANSIEIINANVNKSFILNDDLDIGDEHIEAITSLDGNGKVITLNSLPFISTLNGTLKNVTFVIDGEFEAKDIHTSVIQTNNGSIENVNVIINASINEADTENDLYISALVGKNEGTIKDCTIIGDVTLIGNAQGNAYYSSLASENNGEIMNCLVKNGSITAENVDLAGLVIDNNGGIYSSYNKVNISQKETVTFEDENSGWNPNCAGIAINNYGVMERCINEGKIEAYSVTEKKYQILVGGLAINNTGTVSDCTNKGDINAYSPNCSIFAGGLVATNVQEYNQATASFILGTISDSRNYGYIYAKATGESENQIYAGGLTGINQGNIQKTANNGKLIVSTISGSLLIGGLSGYNSGYTLNNNTSYGHIQDCRSESTIGATVGTKQSFIGGLVGNNTSFLTQCFSFCDFSIIDNNQPAEEGDYSHAVFLGSVVGVNGLNLSITGYSSFTANNYALQTTDSLKTTGVFVYEGSILSSITEDTLNYSFTDIEEMIKQLTELGRYWE